MRMSPKYPVSIKNIIIKASVAAGAISCLVNSGCKTMGQPGGARVKALQGQPLIYPGQWQDDGTFWFYEVDAAQKPVMDPATRGLKFRHAFKGYLVGDKFNFTIQNKAYVLDPNPAVTYSWISNSQEWTCDAAEEFVNDKRPTDPVTGGSICYVEVTSTGDMGFAVHVIGFPEHKGLEDWINSNRPALDEGPTVKLSDAVPLLKPGQVNSRLDKDKVLEAMEDVRTVFKSDQGEGMKARNTCIKNQRAVAWTDLQAHFYCEFPLQYLVSEDGKTPYRMCYIRALLKGIEDGAKNPHEEAFNECWAHTDFFKDAQKGEMRTKAYRYVMWVKQGALDFNIEDENDVINKIYGVQNPRVAVERPRRIMDTYPNWLPDQPRYNKIREYQKAMQDKIKGLTPMAPPVVAPFPAKAIAPNAEDDAPSKQN
jgi:hypothetical protein